MNCIFATIGVPVDAYIYNKDIEYEATKPMIVV